MNAPATFRDVATEISIDPKFRGPPDSSNGGYICGLIAKALTGPVEVTLRLPPPLAKPMSLVRTDTGAELIANSETVAEARPCSLELDVPEMPMVSETDAATAAYIRPEEHALPGCFVCGPDRAVGDGLRIFAGPSAERKIAATSWIPEAQYADKDGAVRTEIIWAALDCPSYFGLCRPGLFALLGRMAAEVIEHPRANERCTVIGWPIGSDGRKHFAGSALFGPDGRLMAKAKATWIELMANP